MFGVIGMIMVVVVVGVLAVKDSGFLQGKIELSPSAGSIKCADQLLFNNPQLDSSKRPKYQNFIGLYKGLNPDSYGNIICPVKILTNVNTGENRIDIVCNKIHKEYDQNMDAYAIYCRDNNNNSAIQILSYYAATSNIKSKINFSAIVTNGDKTKVHTETENPKFQVYEMVKQ